MKAYLIRLEKYNVLTKCMYWCVLIIYNVPGFVFLISFRSYVNANISYLMERTQFFGDWFFFIITFTHIYSWKKLFVYYNATIFKKDMHSTSLLRVSEYIVGLTGVYNLVMETGLEENF